MRVIRQLAGSGDADSGGWIRYSYLAETGEFRITVFNLLVFWKQVALVVRA
jgi:hypothetical protein